MPGHYTEEEIKRIMRERLTIEYIEPKLKRGLIAEWSFEYPTGKKTVDVECAYPMYEEEHDEEVAHKIIMSKITNKVWEICGKYTLATGDKL